MKMMLGLAAGAAARVPNRRDKTRMWFMGQGSVVELLFLP
jgi:hypothetical protein